MRPPADRTNATLQQASTISGSKTEIKSRDPNAGLEHEQQNRLMADESQQQTKDKHHG